ncbi:MAG TPA: hypothetical protein VF615_20365 [Longimicrobiaceae bacterium]|jgi:hypothetical protein
MRRLLACVPILLCAAGCGEPVARAIWEAMGTGTGLRRLTLAPRSEPRRYGSWSELGFYARDFAASPAGAD